MRQRTFRTFTVLFCIIVFFYLIWFHKANDSSFSCQILNQNIETFTYDDIIENSGNINSFAPNFQIIVFKQVDKNNSLNNKMLNEMMSEETFNIKTLTDVFDLLFNGDTFLIDINCIHSFFKKYTSSVFNQKISSIFQYNNEESEKDGRKKLKLITFGINSKDFFSFNHV
jgi:hypothetical protein